MADKPACPEHGTKYVHRTWSNQYIHNFECGKCNLTMQKKQLVLKGTRQ